MTQALGAWHPPVSTIPVTGQTELGGTFVQRIALQVAPGRTLAEILAQVTTHPEFAEVHILSPRGMVYGPIPAEWWPRIRPQLGRTVVVHVVPRGGGGDNRKERFWISIGIAVVAAAVTWGVGSWVGGSTGAFWGAMAGAAVSAAGGAALALFMPPPVPKMAKLSGQKARDEQSRTLSITGSQNRASFWGPVPVIYGQHRVYRGPA